MIHQIKTADQFFQLILENKQVVVKFSAVWCGPCASFSPVFEAIAQEDTNTTYAEVDVDQLSQLTEEYAIRGIPAVLFFESGHYVGRVAGAANKSSFLTTKEKMFNR